MNPPHPITYRTEHVMAYDVSRANVYCTKLYQYLCVRTVEMSCLCALQANIQIPDHPNANYGKHSHR
jgi:hypothetical protein